MTHNTSRSRSLHVQLAVAALALAGSAAVAQNVVTRTTQYTYDSTTGQVTLERVDPSGTHCVETAYQYDSFGNKARVDVRPCSSTTAAATFTPRWTINEFASSTDAANPHPAGAYQTRSYSGSGTTTFSDSRAAYDTRHGASIAATEVALVDNTKNLTKRVEYDGLGRVLNEYTPVKRNADNSVVEARLAYTYVYCQGEKATGNAACLNLTQTVPVSYDSQRLVDGDGVPVGTATVRLLSAYFVETTPYDSAGNVIGAKSRVHYDSLHREIAKESQAYDGRWVRTLTSYDALGQPAATWGPHFTDQYATAAFDELRQWTSSRDLLHRPLEQKRYWRGGGGLAVSEQRTQIAYNGTESSMIVPPDSAPDGNYRISVTRRNGAGQVAQTIDPNGATLNMAYDAVGQLVKTVDAFGNATTVSYTAGTARFKEGMVDPDQGAWAYSYDALGQLKSQTDARGKTVTLAYDDLGRLTAKTTANFNVYWYYTRTAAGSVCAYGLNRLCETQGGNTPATSREQFSYDTLGRAWRSTTTLDRAYVSDTTFDDLGRVQTVKYPTGLTVAYAYSAAGGSRTPGVLEKVYDNANTSRVFWRIDTLTASQVFNARGQLQQAQLGNGVALANDYDPVSGKAFTLRATVGSNPTVLDQRYEYDKSDNVAKRTEGNTGVIETNGYDMLERLKSYQVASASDASAARTVTLQYNAIGNIIAKSDVGTDGIGGYTYSTSTKPHAVQTAGGTTYYYDANGNVTSTTGVQTRTQTWTDFNLPDTLSLGSNSVSFLYDANYKRVKEVTTAGTTVRTLYLIHPDNAGGLGFEREETKVSGALTKNESRHYIGVPGATIVVKTLNDAGVVSSDNTLTHYWHKDSLGSIIAVSDASGAVQERMAFDAWGRRTRFTGKVDPTVDPANGNRGYTGHEHLDELGLIHMNARVMDPVLGRFLSPDTFVQTPENLQSYNRYSYVFNNPLRYTDPSGHLIDPVSAAIAIKAFAAIAAIAATQMGNKYWQMAGAAALAWSLGGTNGLIEAGMGTSSAFQCSFSTFAAGGVGNSVLAGALTGFVASGGDFDAALVAGVSAGAFTAIGASNLNLQGKAAMHALVGCVQGAASGGRCGPSAMAAAFGKLTSETSVFKGPPSVSQFMATIAVSGTASVVGGGKFANGAYQGAWGYIFNRLSQAERARLIGAGMFLGGSAGATMAGGCAAGTGGVCALGAPAIVGAGVAAGGALGAGVANVVDWVDSLVFAQPPANAYDPDGPKAPGKPPAEVGFKDPKGGENWVPNPNPGKGGSGYGWQDASGDVWVPSGQGGRAHGGPHWDVQTPGGGYRNVRPPKKE